MDLDTIAQNWNTFKDHLKNGWKDLTEQDLQSIGNSMEEAIEYLQKKYGQTKEAIEDRFYELFADEDGYGKEE